MLRVLSWNLWWRFGPWEQRQPAIEQTLAAVEADIIGLQETWSHQAERLAATLGFHHVVAGRPSPDDPDETAFGNAILSRWPIVQSMSLRLPTANPRGWRSVLFGRVDAPFGAVPFFVTHLTHRYDESAVRSEQLLRISEFIADHTAKEDPYPPVLCADLNAVPDSDEVRMLTGRAAHYVAGRVWTDAWEQVGEGPGLTWSSGNQNVEQPAWPNRRLDYVLIGWPRPRPAGNPVRAWLVGTEPVDGVVASDHYGVAAELATPKPSALSAPHAST